VNDARRFDIADGLILIAGVGVGLGLVRYVAPRVTSGDLRRVFLGPSAGWTPQYALQIGAELCVLFVTPFVAAWTVSCLLVQLRRRRPRHLRRAPGFVACLLPTLGCALTIATTWTLLGRTAWGPEHPNGGDFEAAQFGGSFLVGSSVLWAWATMMVCGVCRARPTWTDLLGRLTGFVWVAIGLLSGGYLLLLI
jgi:hypothetical protein